MTATRRAACALDSLLDETPPASGAVVMGTGIVSIALSLAGHELLSRVLLVIAGVTWLVLTGLLPVRAAREPARFCTDLGTPAGLTSVAATAVLGTRLTLLGWDWAGEALLVLACAIGAGLYWPVLRRWATPTVGTSFMLTVSSESLAVLATALSAREGARWLLYAALAPFLLGLWFYAFVVSRFDLHQLLVGRGDQWITGGALAISTLAVGQITLAAKHLHVLTGLTGTLEVGSLVLWALTLAWLPPLLATEALRPRLFYDTRRWSTVFPIGMYSACSFAVGAAVPAAGVTHFARVWVWLGVAVWAVAFVAMLGRGRALSRRCRPLSAEGSAAPTTDSRPDR